jgi:transcriptional regulator with XRE-family HTH domain
MRLGNVIRRWRLAEDRTLHEVSQEIGIPLSTLQRIETGKPWDSETMAAILFWLIGKQKSGTK